MRLTSMITDLTGTAADQTVDFTYTPSGQIATMTNSNDIYDPVMDSRNDSFSYNSLNQISDMNGDPFSYDSAGNLTSAKGQSYSYDYANRLIDMPGMGSLSYDPLSRLRDIISASGNVTSFVFDGQDIIAEYDNGVLAKRYVHGPGVDEPIAEYDGTDLNETFLIADVRGSIVAHAIGGTSIATNTYDPYGAPGANNSGRFQYTGQVWIEELQLYYYKARFYSPVFQRFLTPDPIGYGDGMNVYAYVHGDPINMRDPSGMTGCSDPVDIYYSDCYDYDYEEVVVTGTRSDPFTIHSTYNVNLFPGSMSRGLSGSSNWGGGPGNGYVQLAQAGGDIPIVQDRCYNKSSGFSGDPSNAVPFDLPISFGDNIPDEIDRIVLFAADFEHIKARHGGFGTRQGYFYEPVISSPQNFLVIVGAGLMNDLSYGTPNRYQSENGQMRYQLHLDFNFAIGQTGTYGLDLPSNRMSVFVGETTTPGTYCINTAYPSH